jgi:soluble lytic murein transglycosylase-like protein
MQIDKRYHREFAERLMPDGSLAWQNPKENILYAGRYLRGLISRAKSEGVGVAAYNAGPQAIKAAEALGLAASEVQRFEVANALTTGGNYGSDVLSRRAKLKTVLFPQEVTP